MSKYDFQEIYKSINTKFEKEFFISVIEEIFNSTDFKGHICPVCNEEIPIFLPNNVKKQLWCPKCGSYDRHRLIMYYLKNYTDIFTRPIKLLHFAPEDGAYKIFCNNENIDYLPVDLNPGPNIKKVIDMCSIPYPENSFDVIYNSHVLEHIVDDIQAMKELYRCVKPKSEGGFVILMVPLFRKRSKTFENKKYNTKKLRLKYFGQEDHVRKYGRDIIDRLQSVGFDVEEIHCETFFEEKLINLYGFDKEDTIFICTK